MRKFIEDIIHAGVGLTQVTKDQVEKIFNELKERGEVYEKDRDIFIKRTLEKLEKKGREFSEKMKSPNTKQMEELNRKIDALVKEVEELKKKKA
jgi:polyhydroxyalkanoate synthesis regulator phasin